MLKFKTLLGAAVLTLVANLSAAATFNLVATVNNGAYAGMTGTGIISWDDGLITGFGDESIGPVGGTEAMNEDASLTIEIGGGGILFTQTNDVDYPDFPVLNFVDGALNFINYVVVDGESGADLAQFGVSSFSFARGILFDTDTYYVNVDVEYLTAPSAVPLPAGLPLMAGALAVLGLAARRRKA